MPRKDSQLRTETQCRIICNMSHAIDSSPSVTTIEFPEELAGSSYAEQPGAVSSPLDLALRSTEAALSQVTKLVMARIEGNGDASPQVEAAERHLRDALRQLGAAKRHPHDSL